MKITCIRYSKASASETISTCEPSKFIERIQTETKDQYVSGLRTMLNLRDNRSLGQYIYIDKLPRVCPAIEYGRTKAGERTIKAYNGIVLLDINGLANDGEVELVKEQARKLPQTFAAFMGSSGRSVKIWVRFVLTENGGVPTDPEKIRLFHAHAYQMAVKCYQPTIPFPITVREPSPEESFRMTFDTTPYYNPAAVPFSIDQPMAMPEEESYQQRKQQEKSPLQRLVPGYETFRTFTYLFEVALARALDELEEWKRGDDVQPVLTHLAEHCYKTGIPEEEVVRQVRNHFYYETDENTVRQTVHNLYRECKGFGKRSAFTPEQETTLLMEEFMNRRYEFRFNQLSSCLEYRKRDSVHFYFTAVDQRARSGIALDALQEGLRVWDRDVNRYLTSNRIPLYNPVDEYLQKAGRWDGKDRIRAFADFVPCDNPHWQELFYRWFLNMVAHWQGRDCTHANSTSPLLVGAQGYRKSTFCRFILPPELRFGYTDSLDFKSKRDAEMSLGRFLLINIDEFDQISVSQQGFLKHLLQKPVANLRKPHGSVIEEVRRYASFIGTSNHTDLLTDTSGSRRFICIEVKAPIVMDAHINYPQLYAQAVYAIAHGERYWFDDTDEAILKETNQDFERISPLEELVLCHICVPKENEDYEELTALEILEYLYTKTKVKKVKDCDIRYFGRILKKYGFEKKKTNTKMLYQVVKL